MRKTVFNTLKAPVQAYSVLTVNKPLQVAIPYASARQAGIWRDEDQGSHVIVVILP